MNTENNIAEQVKLFINQEVFVVIGTTKSVHSITSVYNNKNEIEGRITLKEYNDTGASFRIEDGVIKGHVSDSYNTSKPFTAFVSQEDAAEFLRSEILKENNRLKDLVQKSMEALKQFRIKHHEILWTDDTAKWIENFQREYQW